MKRTINLLSILLILIVVGCSSLYTGVVTITSVVDSAMKEWASLSVAGKTNPGIDNQVIAAHNKYREAAGLAQTALMAYKAGGNQADYQNALAAVRVAASGLLDFITPLLTPSKAQTLHNNFDKAKTL